MKIFHRLTQEDHEAIIEVTENVDWKRIKSTDQFEFTWEREKSFTVFKLSIKNSDEILGLISVEDIPKEWRIHIRLIELSTRNKGRHKEYDRIAGCLIAFICELALEKEGYDGFVSLEPKTTLVSLYQEKYGFRGFGQYLYSELNNSERLVKKYL